MVGQVIIFNFLEDNLQKNFLTIFNFGYPDILKIKSVLNLNRFKSVRGNEVIKCNTILFGFCFFNKKYRGKKDNI